MTDTEIVKIRQVLYTDKGYQHGILLPPFNGSIHEAFDFYSKKWMFEHTDKDGLLFEYIPEKDANSVEEFTVKDDDHFFIGIMNTHSYEGITDEYKGYYGCALDKYGFEKMIDNKNTNIRYSNE